MLFSFCTRACCSGVSVGIEPIMRMSSAMDFDSPTTPSLAAA